MEIKKIVICGDSFCAGADQDHFSHLLANRYNYDVINLAFGGMSTVGICFQIREAISLDPNFIIYNTTFAGRVDLIMNGNFKLDAGLKNFVYTTDPAPNSYVGNIKSPIWSTPWRDVGEKKDINTTAEQKHAVELYLKYLLQWQLKGETDSWMIQHWHDQVIKSSIVPIRVASDDEIAKPMYDFALKNKDYPKPHHTDSDTQEVMASRLDQEIQRLILQKNML